MRVLRRQFHCTLPSVFALPRVLFVVALSFMASLHQRFMKRPNGCRESCSTVNRSVSARLKPADSVACCSVCQVARGQLENIRHVTCFNSQFLSLTMGSHLKLHEHQRQPAVIHFQCTLATKGVCWSVALAAASSVMAAT